MPGVRVSPREPSKNLNEIILKSQSEDYLVIIGFNFKYKYWFGQLRDNTGIDTVHTVEVKFLCSKKILDFIRKFASAKCPHVRKIKKIIANELNPKDIFIQTRLSKKKEGR